MKSFILSFFACFVADVVVAQPTAKELKRHFEKVATSRTKATVIESLDTIFDGGVAYSLLIPTAKSLMTTEYSLRTLSNQEVAVATFQSFSTANNETTTYWEFTFLESGQKAEIAHSLGLHNLAKNIVKNNLFANDSLNMVGVNRMVQVYGTKFSEERNRRAEQPIVVVLPGNNGGNNGRPTYQNRPRRTGNERVTIFFDKINVNGQEVGSVSESSTSERGQIVKRVFVYDSSGQLVADAICTGITNHTWSVQNVFDRRSATVVSRVGRDTTDVAEWVVRNGYL